MRKPPVRVQAMGAVMSDEGGGDDEERDLPPGALS